MSNTVDRGAETRESEEDTEVDRVGLTEETEVDRSASTQEPAHQIRLILHVHPTENQSLLKGIPDEPQKYALGQTVTFGRGEGVSIFLNDKYASKNHLELTFHPTQQGLFKVKNIGRKLLINNSDIPTGSEHCLTPGNIIEMGQLTFITEIVDGNDYSSYILEFKKGSRGPNHTHQSPHQPSYPVPQYPQVYPHNIPGQMPNHVHQPYVQSPLPGYPGITPVPMGVAPNHASFPFVIQPALPPGGIYSHPVLGQHSPSYEQQGNARREAFLNSGESASENDDSLSPKLSVEETHPPELESLSLGESFKDSHPPKQ